MRSRTHIFDLSIGVLVFLLGANFALARTFTSTDGRKIEATVLKVTQDSVVLSRPNVGNVTVPLSKLIDGDRKFLKTWAENEKKNRIPKVEILINTNKRDRREENAYEDRRGSFQFEIKIENEERNFNIENATATLVVLGDYLYRNGEGVVMERKQFKKFSIPDGGSINLSGDLVRFEYDKSGYKHGQKYDGYLFQVKSAAGKVIMTKGSTSRVVGAADLILKLRQAEHYDEKTFKPIRSSSGSTLR